MFLHHLSRYAHQSIALWQREEEKGHLLIQIPYHAWMWVSGIYSSQNHFAKQEFLSGYLCYGLGLWSFHRLSQLWEDARVARVWQRLF